MLPAFLAVLLAPLTFQVGAARESITPNLTTDRPTLGGYTARGGKKATAVHDPVNATAIVVQAGSQRLALVSCDMLTVPASLTKAVLQNLPGWTQRELILAATHTHCAPDSQRLNRRMTFPVPGIATFDAKALLWTADRIAKAVSRAASAVHPATLRVGSALAGLSRLRRVHDPAETNPVAPVGALGDWREWLAKKGALPDADVLRVAQFDGADGKPIALLANYAAHPTIFDDKMLEISAEWPGVLERAWEQANPGAMMAVFNGAQGDRSPSADEGGSDEGRLRLYAARLLGVVRQAEANSRRVSGCSLSVSIVEQSLPKPIPSPALLETMMANGIPRTLLDSAVAGFVPTMAPCLVARLGDMTILAVPGEPSTRVGRALRAAVGDPNAFLIGLANDWVGYILSAEQYARGGYETSVSFHGPGLADAFIRGFRRANMNILKTND